MNDNIEDLKAEIEKLKAANNETWAGGQKQALMWVLGLLNGDKFSSLGYHRALCEEIKAKIDKIIMI